MEPQGTNPPLWARLAFLAALTPFAALAAAFLAAGSVMARGDEVYAATVFLTLGGLLAWYVLALGLHIVRGQWG